LDCNIEKALAWYLHVGLAMPSLFVLSAFGPGEQAPRYQSHPIQTRYKARRKSRWKKNDLWSRKIICSSFAGSTC